jgi:hypothetical protein
MKTRTFLIIGFLIFSFLSAYCQWNEKIDKKTEKIKLVTFDEKPIFVYENIVSIIDLEKDQVIECIKKRLKDSDLCELRRKNYNAILKDLTKNDSSFYCISPAEAPSEMTEGMDKKTGFFPLDYYSTLVFFNISKKYTAPYGYTISIDTSNLIHLQKCFDWMISDLVLKGQARIYNKKSGNYEKEVQYEIVHFDGGHGGEQLLFKDNSLFFIVDSYSDMIIPDSECDEEYQKSLK